MIKFFRKIRQNLLSEGKTVKYLKYAIGEILLVVIGIFIAIQLNNWNENRIDQHKAHDYLIKLNQPLNFNLAKLNDRINNIETRLKLVKELTAKLIGEGNKQDDAILDSLILNIYTDFNITLDNNILIEGINNGKINLVKSDTLRESMYKILSYHDYLRTRENNSNEDFRSFMEPYLLKNFNYRNYDYRFIKDQQLGQSKIYKQDNFKILQDQEFENYMANRIFYFSQIIDTYKNMQKHYQTTIDLIDVELGK